MSKKRDLEGDYLRVILGLLLCVMSLLAGISTTVGQTHTITKLKLFPDRDEVLIKDVTVDSLGFIWFLTNGEVYRYDGYRSLDVLKTIADQRLTDDMPQRILIDRQNRLWMAGNANLSYLDLKTWTVHPIDSTLLPPIQHRTVSWMKQLVDSTIMLAYENGHLLSIAGDNYTLIDDLYQQGSATGNRVSLRCATYGNGNFWMGTTSGGLLSIAANDINDRRYRQLPGIDRSITHLITQNESLLIDVYEQGLYRLGSDSILTSFIPDQPKWSSDRSYVLAEGEGMYAYADDESVYLLDTDFKPIQRLAIPSMHRFNTTNAKVFGNEVLLGTDEGIFVVYPKTRGLSHLAPTNPGANKSTRGIYVYPDGALFYGTYNGAGFIEPNGGDTLHFPGLKHAYALLPINANELLIGTEGGFLKIFNRKRRTVADFPYSLSETAIEQHAYNLPTHVMSLAETDEDYLIGSMSGLWLLDKTTRQLRKYQLATGEPHALDLNIRHIRQDGDSRLLLSTNIGLFELDHGTLTKRYPQSGNLGVFKSIRSGDTTWVATQGSGLVGIGTSGAILQSITTDEGLGNNLVYSLEQVGDILVVGTANGLNLLKGNQVRRIGMAEGLGQSEFNSGASVWDTVRNHVYVGGLTGYTVLDMRQSWFEDRSPMESYITEIHVSTGRTGHKSADYSWPYRGGDALALKPDQSLKGLYLGTPGNYRLDSKIRYSLHTSQWETLEQGQFISLIAPAPGDYQLALETVNTAPTGIKKSITITKQPAYYETWWFKVLIVAGVILLMWFWNRGRLRKIHREQLLRNRIAADLHDEVGSSLTRIYYQSGTLSANGNTTTDNDKQLRQIASTSRQALLSMSDMVWSIDSRFDTVKDLVIRMKDYAYKLREELHVPCRFDVRDDYESKQIGQLVRQNLFLVFKEALNNAVQYGDGSEISAELVLDKGIRLEVRNHFAARGNGYTPATKQGGRGMESMRQRTTKMGGELTIDDGDGIFKLTVFLP